MSHQLTPSDASKDDESQPASTLSFASRARAKKLALATQKTIAPPPGLSAPPPGLPASTTRGRSRVPSPSFYGVHDGRDRRYAQAKPLLPITPSLQPTSTLDSPLSPSPVSRTPSPSREHQFPSQHDNSSTITVTTSIGNAVSTFSSPALASTISSTATSDASTREGPRKLTKKKQSTHPSAFFNGGMRTGSTSSANASSASFTSSTSAGRESNHMPSILGISMPSPSYSNIPQSTNGIPTPNRLTVMNKSNLRSFLPTSSSSATGILQPGSLSRERGRSQSGPQTTPAPKRTSLSGSAPVNPLPRLSTANLPPAPIAIPAVTKEAYASSPSTGYSPGMFSYNSTPTSSSTNPSSLQSPGPSPMFNRVRTASPASQIPSRFGGPTASNVTKSTLFNTDKSRKHIDDKSKAPLTLNTQIQKRESTISASSASTLKGTEIKSALSPNITPTQTIKPNTVSIKHARKSSKETNDSKLSIFGHFRKSSKDSSTPPTSFIPSLGVHKRKTSQDSSKGRSSSVSSTNETPTQTATGGGMSGIARLIPKPIRPTRDRVPDLYPEGSNRELPVIQTGVIPSKDKKALKPTTPTSSSLPQRRGTSFGSAIGSGLPLPPTAPGLSSGKSSRVPTPTSTRALKTPQALPGPSVVTSLTKTEIPSKKRKEERSASTDRSTATTPTSRPGIFGVRGRTKSIPSEAQQTTNIKKAGPMAGSGHEAYPLGKPARVRSSSGSAIPSPNQKLSVPMTISTGSWNKATATKALTDKNMKIDGFFLDRSKPVIIAGGGEIIENRNNEITDMSRSQSAQSTSSGQLRRPSRPSEAISSSPVKTMTVEKAIEKGVGIATTSSSPVLSSILEPYHPRNDDSSPNPSYKDKGAKRKSVLDEDFWADGKEGSWMRPALKKLVPPISKPASPPSKPRYWNPFQRSQSVPEVKAEATSMRLPPVPPFATHHAPYSSEDVRNWGNADFGGFIQDVHTPSPSDQSIDVQRTRPLRPRPHGNSILLPDPPMMPAAMNSPRTPSPGGSIHNPSPSKSNTYSPMSSITPPSPAAMCKPPGVRPMNSAISYFPDTLITDFSSSQTSLHMLQHEFEADTTQKIARPPPGLPIPNGLNTKFQFSPVQNILAPDVIYLPDLRYMPSNREMKARQEVEEAMDSDSRLAANIEDDITSPLSKSAPCQSIPFFPKTPPPPASDENATPPTPPSRSRLQAVGRIPALKQRGEGQTTIKIPKLADILPPPPELPRQRTPIMIHPPRKSSQPAKFFEQDLQAVNKIDSDVDDIELEEEDFSSSSKRVESVPNVAPLVTSDVDWPLRNNSLDIRDSHDIRDSQDIQDSQDIRGSQQLLLDDWNEYDDYLDEMTGTPKTKAHTSTIFDESPFAHMPVNPRFKPDLKREISGKGKATEVKDSPTLPCQATFASASSFPASNNKKNLVLDKGKIVAARPLAARPLFSPGVPSATAPFFSSRDKVSSITSTSSSSSYGVVSPHAQKTIAFVDFMAAYTEQGTRLMSVVDPLNKATLQPASEVALLSPQSTNFDFDGDSDDDSLRQSVISAMPGTEDATEGEMRVRLWALMTSKWLSFGRILVSPAHEEIRNSEYGNRILVIDGLGNDDWSFYCSLHYTNATVYNLTNAQKEAPMSPSSENIPRRSATNVNNHHHIHHASFASPFPFPSGFFSVVTFRFLPPNSDALWPFIISQCIRVLRPGGYIELSVLDIDMVNMGPRTKSTVDGIKETLHNHNSSRSDWSKKNPSDKALHLMARKGFTNITRCWVGLPAVGNVDGSREERASVQQVLKEAAGTDDIDMSSPEGMNRVVSKVGRWWYAKCFQETVYDEFEMPHYQKNLWEDKTVLRECEKKKTNFRMLITFAKKPLDFAE